MRPNWKLSSTLLTWALVRKTLSTVSWWTLMFPGLRKNVKIIVCEFIKPYTFSKLSRQSNIKIRDKKAHSNSENFNVQFSHSEEQSEKATVGLNNIHLPTFETFS